MARKRHEPPIRHPKGPAPVRRQSRARLYIGGGVAVALAVVAAWFFLARGSTSAGDAHHEADAVRAPVSGPTRMAGVEVDERAFNIGRIPLDTPVSHAFKLANTGSTPATIGKVRIEVIQGCCPPDPPIVASAIAPGGVSQLVFDLPMGMHRGMGGPHLFRIVVPVQSGAESGELELYVSGMFG